MSTPTVPPATKPLKATRTWPFPDESQLRSASLTPSSAPRARLCRISTPRHLSVDRNWLKTAGSTRHSFDAYPDGGEQDTMTSPDCWPPMVRFALHLRETGAPAPTLPSRWPIPWS